MKPVDLILKQWWTTRYVPESVSILDEIDKIELGDKEKSEFFLNSILEISNNPQLNKFDPLFPDYTLPEIILENNKIIRQAVVKNTTKLLNKENLTWKETKEFIVSYHSNIKRAQNRWLVANAGLLLEWTKITDKHQKFLTDWLRTNGVNIGDDTIHLHVISNSSRQKIKEMGLNVPYDHWNEYYYKDMLAKCVEIMETNPKVKGLFCDSSWTYNPHNFEIAPDGKPFVSFDFLKDTKLAGETVEISDFLLTRDFQTQLDFAIASDRRKTYFDQGIFKFKVMASFYNREKLIDNKNYFLQGEK